MENINKALSYVLLACVVAASFVLRFAWILVKCVFWTLVVFATVLFLYGLFLNVQFIADFFGGELFGWIISIAITLCFNVAALLVSAFYAWLGKGYEEPIAYLIMWPLIISIASGIFNWIAEAIINFADCDESIAEKIKHYFGWYEEED